VTLAQALNILEQFRRSMHGIRQARTS